MEKIKNSKSILFVKIALGLLFASVLLPSNLKAIAIGIFGVSVLYHNLTSKKFSFNRNFFLINSFYFLIIVLSVFYSANIDYAGRKLQTMASAFIFPIIFAMLNQEDAKIIFKNYLTYLLIYITSVFLFNVIPFAYFYITNYTFDGMLEHFPTVINVDMGKFNIHPIYLSMHCSVAILFSFFVLRNLKSKVLLGAVLGMDITLILFLLLYAKKGPLIAMLIVFSLFVAFQKNRKLIKPYLFAVIGFILLIIVIPKTRERFVELLSIESVREGEATSTNIRYTIYDTATNLIAEAPFTGYGVGDYNDVLLEEYKERGDEILVMDKYNAHNQYLSFMLIGGVFVLLAFLLMIGVNLIFAIRFNNQLLILLLIFYGIVMFTENILEREAGIIYFSFFLSFFGFLTKNFD